MNARLIASVLGWLIVGLAAGMIGWALDAALEPAGARDASFTLVSLATAVTCVVDANGYDVVTAISAGLGAVGDIGAGLGEIGPSDTFAHFPSNAKSAFCVGMIAGCLELCTIPILFHRNFWRR